MATVTSLGYIISKREYEIIQETHFYNEYMDDDEKEDFNYNDYVVITARNLHKKVVEYLEKDFESFLKNVKMANYNMWAYNDFDKDKFVQKTLQEEGLMNALRLSDDNYDAVITRKDNDRIDNIYYVIEKPTYFSRFC